MKLSTLTLKEVKPTRIFTIAYLNNNATPYAAPAARAPISITFRAPDNIGTPVILLLKYPKTKRQIKVAITENFNASLESFMKIYGLSGIIPPTT